MFSLIVIGNETWVYLFLNQGGKLIDNDEEFKSPVKIGLSEQVTSLYEVL